MRNRPGTRATKRRMFSWLGRENTPVSPAPPRPYDRPRERRAQLLFCVGQAKRTASPLTLTLSPLRERGRNGRRNAVGRSRREPLLGSAAAACRTRHVARAPSKSCASRLPLPSTGRGPGRAGVRGENDHCRTDFQMRPRAKLAVSSRTIWLCSRLRCVTRRRTLELIAKPSFGP